MYENYMNYNYNKLDKDLKELQNKYPFLKICSFGKSVQKRELFLVRLGKGKKHIHLNGAHHGMEWLTSALLVQFVSDLAASVLCGEPFLGETRPVSSLHARWILSLWSIRTEWNTRRKTSI